MMQFTYKDMMKYTKNLLSTSHPDPRPVTAVPASSQQESLTISETNTKIVAYQDDTHDTANNP